MRAPKAVTVVLPAYAVGGAIVSVVRDLAVAAYALRAHGSAMDVLLLHPGEDEHHAAAVRVAAELGLPLMLREAPASGAGAAFLAGFQHVLQQGRADLVVTLDASGRHDATQIPRLIEQLVAEDADIVIGSRWAPGSGTPGLSLSRWLLGRLANLTFRLVTDTRGIADATTSFRVARIGVVRKFEFKGVPLSSHSVQTAFVAMAAANGFRIREGPIIYRLPSGPGGGLHREDVAAFAMHLLALRSRVVRIRQKRLAAPGQTFSDRYFGAAQDLERLATAHFFFDWVLNEFEPYLRGRLLEVGAGLGTITRRVIERHRDLTIVALEPAANIFPDLAAFAALEARVEAVQQTLETYAPGREPGFDTVMYLNVLEHIGDDGAELRRATTMLKPGGALLMFGPALGWLYSELDYKAGHYRRYTVPELRALATAAGLDILSIRYFDVVGVLPYLLVYRILRHDDVTGSTLWWYDRVAVPLSQALARLWPDPPVGKNVIMVAQKPGCHMSDAWIENRASHGFRGVDLRELWDYRELAAFLALRDVKVRYKQAAFGAGWALVQPLAGVAVFTIVFGNFANMPSDGVPYPLFAFAGLTLWNYIAASATRSTQSLVNHSPLVTKVYFPRILAPVAAVLPGMVDLAVGLICLMLLLVISRVTPGPVVLTLPLWIVDAAAVALAIGVWLAALNVRFRDVNHAIALFVQLWLFISPVAYPLSVVDPKWQLVYALNPAVAAIEGFRWAVLGTPWPGPAIGVSLAATAVLLVLGVGYFQRAERSFADII